jgi:serine/threonine protein kinase
MAPESIGQRKYSKQSDVWMFGIVGRVFRFITTFIIAIIIIITIDCRFIFFFAFQISPLHTPSLHFSFSFIVSITCQTYSHL